MLLGSAAATATRLATHLPINVHHTEHPAYGEHRPYPATFDVGHADDINHLELEFGLCTDYSGEDNITQRKLLIRPPYATPRATHRPIIQTSM
jgi:hypothetical protein